MSIRVTRVSDSEENKLKRSAPKNSSLVFFFALISLRRRVKGNWLPEEKKSYSGQLLTAANHSKNKALTQVFCLKIAHCNNLKCFGFNAKK